VNGPEEILGRLLFVLLAASAVDACRSKPVPPPDPQIVTALVADAGIAEARAAPTVRCARPSRALRVGTVDKNLVWSGDVLVEFGGTAAYDPATLAPTMPRGAPDAGAAPPARSVVQRGSKAVVVDSSGKELFQHTGCASSIGEDFPYDLWDRGRFLVCRNDKLRLTLFDIDDPKHPSVRLDRLHEFISPDESYIVGVPFSGDASRAWSKFVPRAKVDRRPVLGAPKEISNDIEPQADYPRAGVTFCGTGQLFAVFASQPGDTPRTIDIFDGADGSLLAQGSGTVALGALWNGSQVARNYASFDAAGAYVILVSVDTVSPGVGATTYVYRLEH
jgi:hypothetical protein